MKLSKNTQNPIQNCSFGLISGKLFLGLAPFDVSFLWGKLQNIPNIQDRAAKKLHPVLPYNRYFSLLPRGKKLKVENRKHEFNSKENEVCCRNSTALLQGKIFWGGGSHVKVVNLESHHCNAIIVHCTLKSIVTQKKGRVDLSPSELSFSI